MAAAARRQVKPSSRGRLARLLAGAGPRLLATVVVVAFVWLGLWQLERAAFKERLFSGYEQAAGASARVVQTVAEVDRMLAGAQVPFLRVRARGTYLNGRQFLLDNRVHEGRAGYEVLTPLVLSDGGVLIVDRGWLPVGRSRQNLPMVEVASGLVEVSGLLSDFPRPGLDIGLAVQGDDWPKIANYPTSKELQQALGRPVAVGMLRLDAGLPGGYVRDWEPRVMGPMRHYGYAVQWFALALTVIAIWAVLGYRAMVRKEGDK